MKIRFLAVPDLLNLVWHSAGKHKMCHSVSCFFANMLCSPCPVTARSPLEKGALLVQWAWCTSVKMLYARK